MIWARLVGFARAIRDWLKILAGAFAIAVGVVLAARATREREAAAEEGAEAELREAVVAGHGDARKRALKALDRIKRAEHIEREAQRNIDRGAKDAKAEDVLDRWRRRANRV